MKIVRAASVALDQRWEGERQTKGLQGQDPGILCVLEAQEMRPIKQPGLISSSLMMVQCGTLSWNYRVSEILLPGSIQE